MDLLDEKGIRISVLFFIIAIILINSIIYVNVFEMDSVLLGANFLMICANVIAILLFKSHKILAYITGLFSFILSLVFHILITGQKPIWSIRIAIILMIVIIYFIFDEISSKEKKQNLS